MTTDEDDYYMQNFVAVRSGDMTITLPLDGIVGEKIIINPASLETWKFDVHALTFEYTGPKKDIDNEQL